MLEDELTIEELLKYTTTTESGIYQQHLSAHLKICLIRKILKQFLVKY